MAGTKIAVIIDGVTYHATLNDTRVAFNLLEKLPLTLDFYDYAQQEKVADLSKALSGLSSSDNNDPQMGEIAYWSPQPRLVFYYRQVGAWNGIHVLGSFDEGDRKQAVQAIRRLKDHSRVTIRIST